MPSGRCTKGPGDLYLDAIAASEQRWAEWLHEATGEELLIAGICPKCRDPGGPAAARCQACEDGHVIGCEHCGCAIKPGTEQVVPICVDQPNGTKTTLCAKCAEAGVPHV